MNIVLFEDPQVSQLNPITLSRPAYGITCGALRLIDVAMMLADQSSARLVGHVRSHLGEFQRDYFSPANTDTSKGTLWLNARLVPDVALLETLETAIQSGKVFRADANGQLAIAMTSAGSNWQPGHELDAPTIEINCRLFEFPHHVIAEHGDIGLAQLATLVDRYDYRQIRDGVYTQGRPAIHELAVLDTSQGPIVIEDGVTISPFCVLHGPLRIGIGSLIAPHALLKGPISVGEHCKVGGELSKTIFESYSNKVHYGYLGSSYVGSWVNLGAGTSNSNLKNTYGTVRVDYESGKQETGMQFLGCIIGDYTKTAIHTSIYTGKILGVCSNVYGIVTKNVPSFANYARSLGEVTEHPAGVMEVTQKRVFERRGLIQEDRHKQLIRAMYEIEEPKRKLANQPPSL